MNFDESKENIQPLRHGRNVTLLELGLRAQSNTVAQAQVLNEKNQFEMKIKDYTGEDPLELWFAYISWAEQSYPKNGHEGNVLLLIEHCLSLFEFDVRYTNDRRLCRLFTKYIDSLSAPLEMYSMLYSRRMFTALTDFYKAWAYYYEIINDYVHAVEVYKKGEKELAQPQDELQQAFNAVKLAASATAGSRNNEADLLSRRKALISLASCDNRYVDVARLPANGNENATSQNGWHPTSQQMRGARQLRCQMPVSIFNDVTVTKKGLNSGQNNAAAAAAPPESLITIAKQNSMRKENLKEAGPWSQAKVCKQQIARSGYKTPGFIVHEDAVAACAPQPKAPPPIKFPRTFVSSTAEMWENWAFPLTIPDECDGSTTQKLFMYPKRSVYGFVEDKEFSIEEIRAEKYNSKNKLSTSRNCNIESMELTIAKNPFDLQNLACLGQSSDYTLNMPTTSALEPNNINHIPASWPTPLNGEVHCSPMPRAECPLPVIKNNGPPALWSVNQVQLDEVFENLNLRSINPISQPPPPPPSPVLQDHQHLQTPSMAPQSCAQQVISMVPTTESVLKSLIHKDVDRDTKESEHSSSNKIVEQNQQSKHKADMVESAAKLEGPVHVGKGAFPVVESNDSSHQSIHKQTVNSNKATVSIHLQWDQTLNLDDENERKSKPVSDSSDPDEPCLPLQQHNLHTPIPIYIDEEVATPARTNTIQPILSAQSDSMSHGGGVRFNQKPLNPPISFNKPSIQRPFQITACRNTVNDASKTATYFKGLKKTQYLKNSTIRPVYAQTAVPKISVNQMPSLLQSQLHEQPQSNRCLTTREQMGMQRQQRTMEKPFGNHLANDQGKTNTISGSSPQCTEKRRMSLISGLCADYVPGSPKLESPHLYTTQLFNDQVNANSTVLSVFNSPSQNIICNSNDNHPKEIKQLFPEQTQSELVSTDIVRDKHKNGFLKHSGNALSIIIEESSKQSNGTNSTNENT